MSESKMREDGLGRDPDGSGCRPSDETPAGSHASGASIPRAELDLSNGLVCAVIADYRKTRRMFGDGSPEAVKARGRLFELEGLCRSLGDEIRASDERPTGPRPSGLGAEPASAIGKAEAPINSVLLSALKAMDEALTEVWLSPEDAFFKRGVLAPQREAWLQIRSAISQADGQG